jgi:hypothetical protein
MIAHGDVLYRMAAPACVKQVTLRCPLQRRRLDGQPASAAPAQYSTGRLLPCSVMISWGEIGARFSVDCTSNVTIDQRAAAAAITTIAAEG